MDSDNESYHFPKCQTHAYTRFENGCSENSTQKLLTKYSTEENNKHVICRPRSVRIPPGRQITYMSFVSVLARRYRRTTVASTRC